MGTSRARTAAQNAPAGIAGNMAELVGRFGDEASCEAHMISLRWPGGFECPSCSWRAYARVRGRREFRCARCGWQFSATSGTALAHTRLPLTKWFRAAFMVCSDPRGASAQAVARECGVSDATGIAMLRRLRTAMGLAMSVCRVGGAFVELDGADVRRGNSGQAGRAGSGAADAPVLVAASGSRAAARVLSDQTAGSVAAFCSAHVSRRSEVRCDGAPAYGQALAGGWGLVARRSGARGDSEASLPTVHHVISNLKSKLEGTCHGVSCARLQEHLDEFCWKYSHRGGDQMADLLAELARWPHVRLADIRGVRGPLPAHAPARDPGYRHDRQVDDRWRTEMRRRLAVAVAGVARAKAEAEEEGPRRRAPLTHL